MLSNTSKGGTEFCKLSAKRMLNQGNYLRGIHQLSPQISRDFITKTKISLADAIIDNGRRDCCLIDCLLEAGFQDLRMLDASLATYEKVKFQLAEKQD